jgi:transposase-like protein
MEKTRLGTTVPANLTVVERVNAALRMVQCTRVRDASVSEISRRAGLNRADLYATYPELVAKILGRPVGERPMRLSEPADDECSGVSPDRVSERESALLCLELQAEVQHLRCYRHRHANHGDRGLRLTPDLDYSTSKTHGKKRCECAISSTTPHRSAGEHY